MALNQAPIQEVTADEVGRFPQVWIRWFSLLIDAVVANNSANITVPAITSSITLTLENSTVLCDATGGSFTVTLPDVLEFSDVFFTIKRIDASANMVTIDGDGANVETLATLVLSGAGRPSVTLQSDGTEWWII